MAFYAYNGLMANQPVKIAYILTPITFGGAERVSLNFLRTVDRNNFSVHPILLTRPWEEEPLFAAKLKKLGYAYETVPVAARQGGDRLRIPRVAWRLIKILKKNSFDLVHTHGYFADICGLAAARLLGIKTISTCHGFISSDRKLRIYNLLDKFALRMCDSVITVSENLRAELARSGIKGDRITVVPNAVETAHGADRLRARRKEKRLELGIAPCDCVVGYLGRLSEEKGLVYLIEALAGLTGTGEAVKLLVVGDGPERIALERYVIHHKLNDNVTFAGFQADVDDWLPAFDVFVLPSLTEGTPMALLEAMALGLPVIATAVGGVPQVVIDGVNGLLVRPADSAAIREKLRLLKANPKLRLCLGKAAVETIQTKFSVDGWRRKIENQYRRILGLPPDS